MKTLFFILLFFSLNSFASDGSQPNDKQWTEKWWSDTYQQRQQEQKDARIKRDAERCIAQLKYYTNKYENNRNSGYYRWKLYMWVKKCENLQ